MLRDYGWSDRDDRAFAPHYAQGRVPARVTRQQRGSVMVVTSTGELRARQSGRFSHRAAAGAYAVAGDWVSITIEQDGQATIHDVLPRRSRFERRLVGGEGGSQIVAANVDVALLVMSLNADFNIRRLERYLAAAWDGGARPVVVLTKSDLPAADVPDVHAVEAVAQGVPIHRLSALSGDGMAALSDALRPCETAVLLGSSGAGKSTLVNALAGETVMATSAIRQGDDRGRHTTTHRELIRLRSGVLLLDTPGMRELGLVDAERGIGQTFADLLTVAAQCRFRDCTHGAEPGCAVRGAIGDGMLDPARLDSFEKLRREADYYQRREDPVARSEAKRKWVSIERAQRANRRSKDDW